jgi:hypothetical protein
MMMMMTTTMVMMGMMSCVHGLCGSPRPLAVHVERVETQLV